MERSVERILSSIASATSTSARAARNSAAPAMSIRGRFVYYRANKNDCSSCALKPKCTTAVVRKVTRDVDEEIRERVRALATTEAFALSRRERKKVEMRFAHMKRILKLDRLRLRGLNG